MGEQYEGIVFCSAERAARRTFASFKSELKLRLVRLARGVFGIYRVAGHFDTFAPAAVERVAKHVSKEVGRAVAVFYDNRCCTRAGVLYSAGRRARVIGLDDTWWVPYGPDGELRTDGPRFRVDEFPPGVECDCIFSEIDAALDAVKAGRRVSAEHLKQAFCYERLEPLAEFPEHAAADPSRG